MLGSTPTVYSTSAKTKIKNTSEDNRARKDSRLNRKKTRVFKKLAGRPGARPQKGSPGLRGGN